MSNYSLLMFDGGESKHDSKRAKVRLTWLQHKISSEINIFPDCKNYSCVNARLQSVQKKFFLIFIHVSAYNVDTLSRHIPSWHPSVKSATTLVLYTGGGIKGDFKKEIDKLVVTHKHEIAGGIYAIIPAFFESVSVSHLKNFVSYFCNSCGTLSTDDPSSIVNFRQNLFLRMEDVNRTFSTPSLNAIAIVCQCYLATQLSDPEQHANIPKTTQTLIGWNRLPAQAKSSLSDRLRQTAAKLNALSWWAETLGFFDKENDAIDPQQKARLLIGIINDMDGKAKAETLQEQLTADGNPLAIEARIFNNADAEYPNAAKVLRLFQHDSVSTDTVCAAYQALAAFLTSGS